MAWFAVGKTRKLFATAPAGQKAGERELLN